MNRAEAHERLDAIYDKLEEAAQANDREKLLRHEGEAHTQFQQLEVGVIGAVRSRRHAAALAARNPFELTVAHPEAVSAGQYSWTNDILRTREGAAAAHRVLARALLDNPILPPGLLWAAAAALFQLNLGESDTWLGKPMKIPGLAGTHARDFHIDLVLLARIYFHAGYHGVALADAAMAVLPDDADGKRWTALQQMRHRNRLQSLCTEMKATGEEQGRRSAILAATGTRL